MLLKKVIGNRFFLYHKAIRYISILLFYPLNLLRFRKFGFGSFCHLQCSINSLRKISVGSNTTINKFVTIWATKLTIGDNTQINPGTVIYGDVIIGNNVMIAPNCTIAGGNHKYTTRTKPMRFQGSDEKPIIIEDDVWIGANSSILGGVTIRKGSIIGAGSVVTKDIQDYTINFGNPCIFIKNRP